MIWKLINKLSIAVSFFLELGNIWLKDNYLNIWNPIKIAYKIVQMKFLAIHIAYQKWSFDIFKVLHLLNSFMEHDLYSMS